jgi:hypothetical protein
MGISSFSITTKDSVLGVLPAQEARMKIVRIESRCFMIGKFFAKVQKKRDKKKRHIVVASLFFY